MGAREEAPKERCMEVYKEEKKGSKVDLSNQEGVHEQFGKNMDQAVNGNRNCSGRK